MTALELLAPARTAEIGIAAIDCGADAVFIAGPGFGARAAAGNSVEDIARLCEYAHRFGVRIYATVNTIVYDSELQEAERLVQALENAGVDALIVQDPAVLRMQSGRMALHASTQCAVKTPDKARLVESMGFGRLVLERQMSLKEIRAVREAVDAELEFFVHGALCVCYSGQCYLSSYLTGRSANRGECAQPCRSLYDLQDASGKTIVRSKALLSLKDYNLLHRLEDLASAGICSFKIEGRLKGMDYVMNTVRAYSDALDALVARHPGLYRRSSFGRASGGFVPDLSKTFNRGYTELYLDGERGSWSSMDAPKSMGEYVGTVERITADGIILRDIPSGTVLSNGDGLAFSAPGQGVLGFRADVCDASRIRCKVPQHLTRGTKIYRNSSVAFDRMLSSARPARLIGVSVSVSFQEPGRLLARAVSEDGRGVERSFDCAGAEPARDPARMESLICSQIGKKASVYSFTVGRVDAKEFIPILPASFLNSVRRELARSLDAILPQMLPLRHRDADTSVPSPESVDYKYNVANKVSAIEYSSRGTSSISPAYELSPSPDAELMRSRYCVRHELGLCPKQGSGTSAPLFLLNSGSKLTLRFHCSTCEMTVSSNQS